MTFFELLRVKTQAIKIRYRKFRYYYYFKSNSTILLDNITLRFKPKTIKVGYKFTILQNAVLEFNKTANIEIGDDCLLSYGVVLALKGIFKMGNNVMIGEYTSIRDFSHDYSVTDIPMAASKDLVDNIKIGNNVWIGRGCIIMPGTIIEDGVVIGSNSVVKGSLKRDSIYAGSPAKFIKIRLFL